MSKSFFELHISGKVQGVWYRKSCQQKARELNISGFVRNEANGTVYCEAEGDIEDLMRFISWCEKGPENAQVENVQKISGNPKGFSDFEIRT